MFVSCTAAITNWLNSKHNLIEDKELRLIKRDIERQQYEAEQYQGRKALEAHLEQHAAEENNQTAAKLEQSQLE